VKKLGLLMLLVVVLLLPCAGCASMLSVMDTQEALAVVDDANVDNWLKVHEVQVGFYDGELLKLDGIAGKQIAAAKNGTEAAAIFEKYIGVRAMLGDARLRADREYGEALDNAILAQELRTRQAALLLGWYGMFKRIPGVETLRAAAVGKARAYLEGDEP